MRVLLAAAVMAGSCHENDPSAWGDPKGGEGNSGGLPDAGDSDTESGDTDTESEPLQCGEGEVAQPATDLCWLRCPLGQDAPLDDGCAGETDLYDFEGAVAACALLGDGYHAATRDEMIALLGGCETAVVEDGQEGLCDPCDGSGACGQMFGFDLETYWTSTVGDFSPWAVSFDSGVLFMPGTGLEFHAVRCVRSGG
jgi:hypothetical protein